MIDTMTDVDDTLYDLAFDPNDVGPDSVVECWISQGPRADDSGFDPQPGDEVTAGDDEGAPLPGRVIRREGNRVWVQLDLSRSVHLAV
jgi:hypothetical protein